MYLSSMYYTFIVKNTYIYLRFFTSNILLVLVQACLCVSTSLIVDVMNMYLRFYASYFVDIHMALRLYMYTVYSYFC